jgi:hypothetical protein
MTMASDLPRIAPSRALVRGILFGSLYGSVGGPLAGIAVAVVWAFSSDPLTLFFGMLATIPAAIVGAVVGAGAGLAGAALCIVVLTAAARLPSVTAGAGKIAASVAAGLGSAGAIAAATLLYRTFLGVELLFLWIVVPVAGGLAARSAWRNIDSLAAHPAVAARERWAWRVLLAGFTVAIGALVQCIALFADPSWWSWGTEQRDPDLTPALVAIVVVAATAAVLLSVGGWLGARVEARPPVEAALVLVAVLVVAAFVGLAALSPARDRTALPPYDESAPYVPAPTEPPPADVPVAPAQPPEQASTLFTAADIIAVSQAQVDDTIALVGPIDDPAIPAGTTSFPVSIGGCGNLAGGAVMFEVWFLVDDLRGGFARARDAWLAQGFVSDQASTEAGDVEVVGDTDSAIRRMTLENEEGTVKFTVQSVCVAGQDY